LDRDAPIELEHTEEQQIGRQIEAKFIITRLPEDTWPGKLIADYVELATVLNKKV